MWLLAWWAAALFLVVALCLPPASAGDGLGIRRFLSPEVTAATRVGQRFRMTERNFSSIALRAAAVGPLEGRYRLSLIDVQTGRVVRHADAEAADLVATGAYTFRFQPLAFSEDLLFDFELAPLPGRPGRGVALWATKGERLSEGALLINGTPRWGSLAFEASTSADSPIVALFSGRQPGRPPRWIALLGLCGAWVALLPVFRGVAELSSDGLLAR